MPNNPTNGPTKKPDNDIENGFGRVLNAELSIGFSDVSRTLTSFAFISLMSVLIGVGFGLISSFICKNVPTLKIHPAREVFLILLVAYLSYVVSEMLFLSGIMTIFCWGITMSYYTLYNMSSRSRKGSQLAVETIGQAAEAFLFAYLGLSLFGIAENHISIEFSFLVLFATFISRAFAIIIPYLLVCKLTEKLDKNQLLIIWFSGLVKGAIAFGLSAQIPGSLSPKRSYLISTTISIVLLSTIIIGGLMSFFASMVGLSKENEMLKRMYASIGRDAGKKNIALSQEEPGQQIEFENDSKSQRFYKLFSHCFSNWLIIYLATTIKGKLMAVKHKIRDKLLNFDSEIMRKYFGGATHDDEEREKEEEEIEEEQALRIFAEQHRHKLSEQDPGEVSLTQSKNTGRTQSRFR